MLLNRQDVIAVEAGKFYIDNLDVELLIFALDNSNEHFLKFAFRNQLFPAQLLYTPRMINILLGILEQGDRTLLVLNVLIYADFGRWPQKDVRKFVDWVDDIQNSQKEQNQIYKCYNPIMTLCLCCEFLMKIGEAISLFKHEGLTMCSKLQILGEKLIENMQPTFI